MRSSRGGLGAIPSRDTAGAPQASARSHQLKAHELVVGWKNRPCRQRVIVAGPNLTSRDLTPNAGGRHRDRRVPSTEIAALSNLKTAPGHLAVRGEPDRTP